MCEMLKSFSLNQLKKKIQFYDQIALTFQKQFRYQTAELEVFPKSTAILRNDLYSDPTIYSTVHHSCMYHKTDPVYVLPDSTNFKQLERRKIKTLHLNKHNNHYAAIPNKFQPIKEKKDLNFTST